MSTIEDISEQVNNMYNFKRQRMGEKSQSELADIEYKNTKIVAWLLNRPISSSKVEREDFFKRLN